MIRHALLVAALLACTAGIAAAGDPRGLWQTKTSKTGAYLHVDVGPCRQKPERLCGYIAETFKTPHTRIVGRPIFWNMAPDSPGKWEGGEVWYQRQRKRVPGRLRMRSGQLRVEGCLGSLCAGQTWTRVIPDQMPKE